MRVPPAQDLEAERNLLSAVLLDDAVFDEVADSLRPEDFYDRRHGAIWSALGHLSRNGAPPDSVPVRAALEGAGALRQAGESLEEICGLLPIAANAGAYAKVVAAKASVRRMVAACTNVVAESTQPQLDIDAWLDAAEARVLAAAQGRQKTGPVHIKRIAEERFTALVEHTESGRELLGASSGLRRLDKILCGFKPGELIVVAGRPGMGKSALAGRFASQQASDDAPCCVFSLEMPSVQWVDRIFASECQVNGAKLRTGKLSAEDFQRLTSGVSRVGAWPLWIDDTPSISVLALRSRCRRIRSQHGLSLIVIDYLQLMRSGMRHESREAEVSEISRSLKALAKELEVPVVALAQLNRECERGADKRPNLSHLRESGAIEQDADVVLFVYRDEVYNPQSQSQGVAELIVSKQRSGPTGMVEVRFQKESMRFANLEDRYG